MMQMTEMERTIKALEICAQGKTCVSCPLTEECKGLYNAAMARAAKLLRSTDWVNVVRCADCVYWEAPSKDEEDGSSGEDDDVVLSFGNCKINGMYCDKTWYCAEGAYDNAVFEQAQGWISVTHRLPKQQATTLVCTESGSVCVAKFYPQDGEWSGPAGKKVRYWMPIPEPPKGET